MSADPLRITARRELFAEIGAERTRVQDYLADTFSDERRYLDSACETVREVAVVLGSPRGGTSVVKQVLAEADNALALPGEHRLFFTLLGLNFPDFGAEEESVEHGPVDPADRDFLVRNLLAECRGEPIPEPDRRQCERFAWEWALRLRLQWPELGLAAEEVSGWLIDAFAGQDWATEPALTVLRTLLRRGVDVNPYYYDLDPGLVRSAFPDVAVPTGPPASTIVEISPFLALRPRTRPRIDEQRPVLVIKASSDAYRIPLLHEVFQDWRVHELHLVRNPMASVNGLIDGWEHTCFWQHDLTGTGHFRQSGMDRWARRHWNFDLCEGWQQLLAAPLPELCAGQWVDPHKRILAHASGAQRIRFEDFLLAGQARQDMLGLAMSVCGLRFGADQAQAAAAERPVNQTVAAGPARWRKRRDLDKVLAIPAVDEMARRLGYDPAEVTAWL
jgi:hypothetical protein